MKQQSTLKSLNTIVSNYQVPVLIICFNRPQYVKKQLKFLRLVKPKYIYLACDGARKDKNEEHKVEEVKALYQKGMDWDCDLKTKFSTKNLGCFSGVTSAIAWFFEHEKEGIILEDDIIPSIDFFLFSEEMLNLHRHNPKVMSISGCNLGYERDDVSYFYARIMNMWGWATWADRFHAVDFEMKKWKDNRFKKLTVMNIFQRDTIFFDLKYIKRWFHIWNTLISKKPNTWDYQFIYHQLSHKLLTVYPVSNLVSNIGFDKEATHTSNIDHFMKKVKAKNLDFPLKYTKEIKPDYVFEREFIKKIWFSQ